MQLRIANNTNKYIPMGIHRHLALGYRNFAGFLFAKTSANKRLFIF